MCFSISFRRDRESPNLFAVKPIIGNYSGLLAACGLCWRMRLRGDFHPPAGRPRGSPLLRTGLESRFPRGLVGAPPAAAPRARPLLSPLSIPPPLPPPTPPPPPPP